MNAHGSKAALPQWLAGIVFLFHPSPFTFLNMKKHLALLMAVLAVMFLSSCATTYPVGMAYTNLRLPVTVGDTASGYTKIGVAESPSILSLIAVGDSSVTAACANDNIKKIHHIDWEVESFFGIWSTYKTVVYGE